MAKNTFGLLVIINLCLLVIFITLHFNYVPMASAGENKVEKLLKSNILYIDDHKFQLQSNEPGNIKLKVMRNDTVKMIDLDWDTKDEKLKKLFKSKSAWKMEIIEWRTKDIFALCQITEGETEILVAFKVENREREWDIEKILEKYETRLANIMTIPSDQRVVSLSSNAPYEVCIVTSDLHISDENNDFKWKMKNGSIFIYNDACPTTPHSWEYDIPMNSWKSKIEAK